MRAADSRRLEASWAAVRAVVVAVAVVLSQRRGKRGRKQLFNFKLVRGAQQNDEGQN